MREQGQHLDQELADLFQQSCAKSESLKRQVENLEQEIGEITKNLELECDSTKALHERVDRLTHKRSV